MPGRVKMSSQDNLLDFPGVSNKDAPSPALISAFQDGKYKNFWRCKMPEMMGRWENAQTKCFACCWNLLLPGAEMILAKLGDKFGVFPCEESSLNFHCLTKIFSSPLLPHFVLCFVLWLSSPSPPSNSSSVFVGCFSFGFIPLPQVHTGPFSAPSL